jgi:photosystem II protein PsbQ
MKRLRSILPLILVLITTFIVSCSSPVTVAPPTYTPEKIAQLEQLLTPIQEARESLTTLQGFIEQQEWIDTDTFIHGPLGRLRQDMRNASLSLLPKDEPKATELAKEVFSHIERLDVAAKARNSRAAEDQYLEAIKDFDAFLNLFPSAS